MNFKSIAIDGPAGAGKSTIAKLLAKKLNYEYLDTGAMYRLYTFYFLDKGLDIRDQDLVNSYIDKIKIDIHNGSFYMDNRNVDKEIRSDLVTKNVSLLSSYKKVRENLVEKQREISRKNNIVVDGRDIGSHVLTNADLKIFLTASPEIRAKRRYDEIAQENLSYQEVLKDIIRRDDFDSSREISPLIMANDAILLDSSNLTIDEVVEKIYRIAEENNAI